MTARDDALRALGSLRVERALRALEPARAALAKARGELAEQVRLCTALEEELERLAAPREPGRAVTAESLRVEADRRHWVRYDLEKESYYRGVSENDVEIATRELARLRERWLRERSRTEALDERLRGLARTGRARDGRRADEAAGEAAHAGASAPLGAGASR